MAIERDTICRDDTTIQRVKQASMICSRSTYGHISYVSCALLPSSIPFSRRRRSTGSKYRLAEEESVYRSELPVTKSAS